MVSSFKIFDKSELSKINFCFSCDHDPRTGNSFQINYPFSAFKEVPEGTGLFKLAAQSELEKCTARERVGLSVKYQVLCEETALIGVMR
jgi:hypothetical protein